MKFSFEATIYKTGINPCVDVPERITKKLKAIKGYISVKGTINKHAFTQTLVPVKNALYRLYVNGPMLKGTGTTLGDTVKFTIEQSEPQQVSDLPMPVLLKNELKKNALTKTFNALTPYRKKEILKYLGFLKSEEAIERNVAKVIAQLKKTGEAGIP